MVTTLGMRCSAWARAAVSERSRGRIVGGLWLAVVLVGVTLRFDLWQRNPSYWVDESRLALNVVYRSPLELSQPLDFNQGAPVGYLWLCKAAIQCFGPAEWVPRGVSLLASLVGLLIFGVWSAAWLPPRVAGLATAWLALSPYLVSYAVEFKQYQLDATVALGLVALGWRCWQSAGVRVGRLAALAGAGAAAVWFSHPSWFVLAGLGGALTAHAAWQPSASRRTWIVALALLGLVWLASAALNYGLILRQLGQNDYLRAYWAGKFCPLPPRSLGDLAWLVHHGLEWFSNPGGFSTAEFSGSSLAACAAMVGLVALWRKDRILALGLLLPLGAALAASAVKQYPFAGRLLLFAVPLLTPLVVLGLMTLAGKLQEVQPGLGWLVVGLAAIPTVQSSWQLWKTPPRAEPVRELVDYLAQVHQPGEGIYVYSGAVPGFAYYAPGTSLRSSEVVLGQAPRRAAIETYLAEFPWLDEGQRGWVVFSHAYDEDIRALEAYLESQGEVRRLWGQGDTQLLQFEIPRRRANITARVTDSGPVVADGRLP